MATLEKIRSKAGLLVLVVGVALFAFIIGDFLNSGSTYFRPPVCPKNTRLKSVSLYSMVWFRISF